MDQETAADPPSVDAYADAHPLPRVLCRIIALYFIYVALIGVMAVGALIQQAAHLSDVERRVYNRGVMMRFMASEMADNLQEAQARRFVTAGGAMFLLWVGPVAVFLGAGRITRRTPFAPAGGDGHGDPLYAPLAVGIRVFGVAAVLMGTSQALYWIMLQGAIRPTTWMASWAMRPYLGTVERGLGGALLLVVAGLLLVLLSRRFAAYLTEPTA